ncbi:glycosyltransferase, partial [Moorena sp. SIO3I8]|uniref:glycosyltransferase n=1 Tax=Moorena sp. SIO3I8 TaxID=2607833 RepID=UPI0013C156F1
MKVLHINQSDLSGGAAIAGYRLHQGLLGQGADSRLLVWRPKTISDRVDYAARLAILDKLTAPITQQLGLYYINKLGTFTIPKHSFYKNADVLNFHVLHGGSRGYFNYLAIPSLTKRKPAVFTFHDMWSFTGHCAYSYDCDRWKRGCGKCPDLNIYPAIPKDNTHIEWKLKNWAYSHSNLTIVTPSRWLCEQAQQSMLNRFGIHHIPNGINTEVYQPLESQQCKSVLNIPTGKTVLMFAATNLAEKRKGGDLLLKALQSLPQSIKAETIVLTFGSGGETIAETVGIPALNLGYASNDHFKAIAYSAADLFLFPTRADNLPVVLQESMACGTPMVSF